MRVVSVVGYKGVGKTTLVEALVPALSDHGRVATVKSIHHDVTIDAPGTDTQRHREAGAETVVGVAPSMTFEVRSRGKRDDVSLRNLLERLEDDGYDFVVVEGFKDRDLASIVVGSVPEEELSGPVLARVAERSDADITALVGRIRDLAAWVPGSGIG